MGWEHSEREEYHVIKLPRQKRPGRGTEVKVLREQRCRREMRTEKKAGAGDSGPAWPSQGQWECTEGLEPDSDTVNGYFEQLSGCNVKKQRRKMEETIAGVQVSEADSLYNSSEGRMKRKK